jgi:hypothetical protein
MRSPQRPTATNSKSDNSCGAGPGLRCGSSGRHGRERAVRRRLGDSWRSGGVRSASAGESLVQTQVCQLADGLRRTVVEAFNLSVRQVYKAKWSVGRQQEEPWGGNAGMFMNPGNVVVTGPVASFLRRDGCGDMIPPRGKSIWVVLPCESVLVAIGLFAGIAIVIRVPVGWEALLCPDGKYRCVGIAVRIEPLT